jgi:hypothetical protein
MDGTRAKHPLTAVERIAGNTVQIHGRRLHPPHPFALFIDEAFNARADTKDLATERHELGVKPKPSVRKSRV